MRHPEAAARLMRPKPGWKVERAGHGNDDLGWQDACVALGGCDALAYAAFAWVLNGDRQARRQLADHLHEVMRRLRPPAGLDADALVQLALDEQHAPQAQRRDDLRALVLGVKDWDRQHKRLHARLLAELDSLVGDAWRVARGRLDAA